ncbi:V-type ATP synthase subunit I [Miniphocaeibacter massiliensis]|uniref:V-type ATP synthase subunit I n=1 Tax=Miniphocaeibacter massiliensis TaxID=2041841 RepID=UPI000C06CCF7|nr:V-type ATP synthase subunit I [Miniphocaeibacter massiliensis]
MSIVKMSKFNLLAFDYDRANLLRELQKFQFVHFNDLTKSEEEKYESLEKIIVGNEINAVSEELVKVNWAIDLLQKYKPKEGMLKSLKEGLPTYTFNEIIEKASKFDFNEVYKNLLKSSEKIERSRQNIHNLNQKIDELKVWEGISIPIAELNKLDKVFITTGVLPTRYLDNLKEDYKDIDDSYFEVVSEEKGNTYILFVTTLENKSRDLEILRKNGYNSIYIDAKGIVRDEIFYLKLEIEESNKTISEEETKLKDSTGVLGELEIYYEFLTNTKLRETSVEKFVTTNSVNVIEGYVPTNKEEEFKKILDNILNDRYYLDIKPAEKDDLEVPIILKNGKFSEAFEGMTEMYSLPKYNEIDPTPLFSVFYAIFAGMMVGDLGYGLLLTIGCVIGLKFFNLKDSMRKFVKFFMFIGICTSIAGIVYGSFFGFTIIEKPILSPANDSMKMIIVALILGGIHLFFGLAIQAYMKIRDKKILDALFDVGFWYMTLIGIIVFALSKLIPAVTPMIGKIGLIVSVIGMIGIVATGGRDAKTIVGKVASGVYELYGITSYIGDFVSYLRIMALALSGGFIALAVNMIVEMLFGAGIIGAIGGLIVFLIFQLFNVFLSYLSAYVHTARLTYVEMFNKFYEGGGKAFKGLIEKSKYFKIEN